MKKENEELLTFIIVQIQETFLYLVAYQILT